MYLKAHFKWLKLLKSLHLLVGSLSSGFKWGANCRTNWHLFVCCKYANAAVICCPEMENFGGKFEPRKSQTSEGENKSLGCLFAVLDANSGSFDFRNLFYKTLLLRILQLLLVHYYCHIYLVIKILQTLFLVAGFVLLVTLHVTNVVSTSSTKQR